MAVAISEMFVYERQVDPTAIQIRAEGDAQTVRLNETLQLYIDTQPEYANNRNVKWTVTDEAGNPTELARVGFDGILRPAAAGKVIIHAEPVSYTQLLPPGWMPRPDGLHRARYTPAAAWKICSW